ncbi:SirA Predicted redox protein, regulator of disulfide bond formation [Rhabdaerophilaceae bacterium]
MGVLPQKESLIQMTQSRLDLLGLRCPLPALKTRKALKGMASGEELVVICNDPMAGLDIPHLLNETGDILLESLRDGAQMRFHIKKG